MTPSLLETLGGPVVLRRIVDDFVARVARDTMIGFFFGDVNLQRLAEREWQLAAGFLGGDLPYSGRPLDVAHQRHRIMGGQFARRTQILRETLADHGVPAAVVEAWLAHTESLRAQITGQPDTVCR